MKDFEKVKFRLDMVNYAIEHGVVAAAKYFKPSRKTVVKWKKRFEKSGIKGLYCSVPRILYANLPGRLTA